MKAILLTLIISVFYFMKNCCMVVKKTESFIDIFIDRNRPINGFRTDSEFRV